MPLLKLKDFRGLKVLNCEGSVNREIIPLANVLSASSPSSPQGGWGHSDRFESHKLVSPALGEPCTPLRLGNRKSELVKPARLLCWAVLKGEVCPVVSDGAYPKAILQQKCRFRIQALAILGPSGLLSTLPAGTSPYYNPHRSAAAPQRLCRIVVET